MEATLFDSLKINDKEVIIVSIKLINSGTLIQAEIVISYNDNYQTFKCMLFHDNIINFMMNELKDDIIDYFKL